MRAIAALVALMLTTAPQAPRFRTGVDAVRVDALVVDGRKPVAGLTADDFELRDSNVVQTIDAVALADVPISVMVALDVSASVSGGTLRRLKEAVTEVFSSLDARDRGALITFSSAVRLNQDWDPRMGVLNEAVDGVRAGGGTSLWDAVFAALTYRDETPTVRRLVLVFSDGDDTSSWLPRNAVVEKASRTDSVVYAVVMRNPGYGRPGMTMYRSGVQLSENDRPVMIETPFLEAVADATGGSTYEPETAAQLRGAFARILTEFRTRYLITYTPQGVERAGWHPIEVKLKQKKGKVTARRGYLR
jgi:Ca-activated chloride channel family protein